MSNGAGSIAVELPEPQTLCVRLSGDWSHTDALPSTAEVESRLSAGSGLRRITYDSGGLGGWDSGLLATLVRIEKLSESSQLEVDRAGLPEGVRRMLELAFAVPERAGAARGAERQPLLERVGERAMEAAEAARVGIEFLGQATQALGRLLTGRAQFRRSDLFVTIQECGSQALPIVSLISILVGMILAFVGAMQLAMFGAQIFIADLVGIGMAREMGAMMAAIIMAGRTGAAFAAQLGTMTVNEEIDALSTMGVSPMDFLVLPRMIALILMMPLLCVYSIALGIAGGAAVAIGLYDITPTQYWIQTVGALNLNHFAIGVFKAAMFGVLIALAGCLRGIQCGRSASAVGEAATSAVVTSIVLIIVSDALVTVISSLIGI